MADRRSLSIIGFAYAGLTVAVMLVAGLVVTGHVSGRMSLDTSAQPPVQLAALQR